MVIVTKIVSKNTEKKEVVVNLFADTKDDNLEDIAQLLDGYKPAFGSSVLTATGDFAYLNSSGAWIWQQ